MVNQKIPTIALLMLLLISASMPQIGFSSGQHQADDLASPFVSYRFIHNSQNIPENELNSLSDIYYYLGILEETGQIGSLSDNERDYLISTVKSFQNVDGGFGDWYRDRSKAGSTLMSIKTLGFFGQLPDNVTGAVDFLSRLQVSGLEYGNFGFRSSVKERDADVSSTYNVIKALTLLGGEIPNLSDVINYLRDHQNYDGGFGYQTNREAGIFWDSTSIHTNRGILGLTILEEVPDLREDAIDFLLNLQGTNGGFGQMPGDPGTVAYTYNAIFALKALGVQIPNQDDIVQFVMNNQLDSGGYIEYDLDSKAGLHTSYWALRVLGLLGAQYDGSRVVDFARNFIESRLDGGFGEYPGFGSTARYSFDAVSVLNLIGRYPQDRKAIVDYLQVLRNEDGGFGENGLSSVETTYRVVLTLQLLGEPVQDLESIAKFIRRSQNNDGGFGFSSGYVSRGSYTYRAIRVLDILGYQPINTEGAITYLRSLENDDGGFGNYFGEGDSDLGSTYRAIRGLSILNSGPLDVDSTEDFILSSMNIDGGFRRSPDDVVSPANLSKSIYTYDAILGLNYLGRPLQDREQTYEFLISLRNPDLGYAAKPFFTSDVASTFTSIWAYIQLYAMEFNTPPDLSNPRAESVSADTTDYMNFTVDYTDTEGQMPEYVHLDLDGVKYLMTPTSPMKENARKIDTVQYYVSVPVAVGEHQYHFETTDGLAETWSDEVSLVVGAKGEAPMISLSVSPEIGMVDTSFTFTVIYSDPDGEDEEFVLIELDREGSEMYNGLTIIII